MRQLARMPRVCCEGRVGEKQGLNTGEKGRHVLRGSDKSEKLGRGRVIAEAL